MTGADLSHYQQGLTIRALRDAGRSFAILKLTEGTGYTDPSAFAFYREAYALGFPVGCYCYSHALSGDAARAEAAHLLDVLNGFPMPCGVYIDVEEADQLALSDSELQALLNAWCAAVSAAGYTPGVYGSAAALWTKLDAAALPPGALVWIAKWGQTPPAQPCDLWQSSDEGRAAGYDGPIDLDEARSARFQSLVRWARRDADLSGACGLLSSYLKTEAFQSAFAAYAAGRGAAEEHAKEESP